MLFKNTKQNKMCNACFYLCFVPAFQLKHFSQNILKTNTRIKEARNLTLQLSILLLLKNKCITKVIYFQNQLCCLCLFFTIFRPSNDVISDFYDIFFNIKNLYANICKYFISIFIVKNMQAFYIIKQIWYIHFQEITPDTKALLKCYREITT